MIFTCPNCNCKFKVSLAVFGREGRNVKCSSCKETWWQEPTLEHVTEDVVEDVQQGVFESDDIVDIAEAAEEDEISEEEFLQRSQERVEEYNMEQGRKLAHYIAGGLFLFILAILLLFSSHVLKSYPSMQGFYKFFGIRMELPDTLSIMFEGIKAEREGTSVTVSGRIVNLSLREWKLPMIEVVVFRPVVNESGNAGEEVLAKWVEAPPEPFISAEKDLPFSYTRHVSFGEKVGDLDAVDEEKDMVMVRVHFVVSTGDEGEPQEESQEKSVAEETAHND